MRMMGLLVLVCDCCLFLWVSSYKEGRNHKQKKQELKMVCEQLLNGCRVCSKGHNTDQGAWKKGQKSDPPEGLVHIAG